MSLLETARARIMIACLFVLIAAVALLAVGHRHVSHVLAAKRVIATDDARAAAEPGPPSAPHPAASPVLVELFTSEGCSDCPPADALLAHLQRDQPVASANVIALEEHVDYWDHLGWRYRFSSHTITERQGRYAQRLHLDDNYTPQMVVDGTDQFVGSDSAHALRAIVSAARSPKLALTLSTIRFADTHASGTVSVNSAAAPQANAELYAALVERTSSTKVLRGENGGHTLQHAATVLAMQKIGDARRAATPLSFSFNIPQNQDPANLAVIVFAQQVGQGAILGAASSGMVQSH